MQKRTVHIDFSKKCGRVKSVHGINLSFPHNSLGKNPIDEIMSSHKTSLVGLHDTEHPYGQNQYVDIHCIFQNPDADPEDENSYNFVPTDEYLSIIRDYGAEIIFRLGESSDSYPKRPYLSVSDPEKWAKIALHVVMHYNDKWANGFKWNIKYFEIWSGADTNLCFAGTQEAYTELYVRTASLIKSVYPRVKVGGFSSLGFSAMHRVTDNEELRGAYAYASKFLAQVSRKDGGAPIDFFTWKCFPTSPEELDLHAKYARSLLRERGLRNIKSIISEFDVAKKQDAPTVSEYLSVMIMAQKTDVDAVLYKYSGQNEAKELADMAFDELYRMGTLAEISEDYKNEIYALASVGERGVLLLCTKKFSGAAEILIKGGDFTLFDITEISEREDGTYSEATLRNRPIDSGKTIFAAKPNSIYIINFKTE